MNSLTQHVGYEMLGDVVCVIYRDAAEIVKPVLLPEVFFSLS